MGFLKKNIIGPLTRLLVLNCIINIVLCLSAVRAQEIIESNSQESALTTTQGGYSYIAEGRNDPFKPFISPKAVSPVGPDPNEIVEEGGELTGMQLFEPGQLSLVGTMLSQTGEKVALVEDQTKKGYILKRGMRIGKRGIITEIESQQVIITETARTRVGQEITNIVTMRLNKEGDK